MDSRQLTAPNLLLQRTPADEDQDSVPSFGLKCGPGTQQMFEVLLSSYPADVGHQQVVGTKSKRRPVGIASKSGMELVRIHATAPDSSMENSPTVQVLLVHKGGTEHSVGLPVKPAQVVPPQPERPLDAVPCSVLVVIGVGRGDDW